MAARDPTIDLVMAFKKLDRHGNGLISEERLCSVISQICPGFSENAVKSMVGSYRGDDDISTSDINYKSFLKSLMSSSSANCASSFPASSPDRSKSSQEGLFRNIAAQLQSQFEEELEKEKQSLRRQYDTALKEARQKFHDELGRCIAGLQSAGAANNVEGEIDDGKQRFSEATGLLQGLQQLINGSRPHLNDESKEGKVFELALAVVLEDVVKVSESLASYAKNLLAELSLDFVPAVMSGRTYPVKVRPCVETVKMVKRNLAKQHDLKGCVVELCSNDGAISFRDEDRLMDYDLSSTTTMVLVDSLEANRLMRLSFDCAERLAYEQVSGLSGEFHGTQPIEEVESDGRKGVNFTGDCALKLPQHVHLGMCWTISVWTRFPMPKQSYRDLIDGPDPQSLLAVLLNGGRIGNYKTGRYIEGWNASELSDGWHHIGVVGEGQTTTYYIDGESIGVKAGRASGIVAVVGNSLGYSESWGVMSDLQIFGAAATDTQIMHLVGNNLANMSSASTEAKCVADIPEPTWQQFVAAKNVLEAEIDEASSVSEDFPLPQQQQPQLRRYYS
eukprot:TRINITY_DN63482_c0_g1_i1.p1 TRINITY_DN63482_c0_g1~~TRINITY_DN63482_c0_g1_i1.p1  ORF type:complete len:561 (-),score=122.95 TRINITY_DN63482_c0_g1_i1:216-1898(-)